MDKNQIRPFVYLSNPSKEHRKIVKKLVHFTEAALEIIDQAYDDEVCFSMKSVILTDEEAEDAIELTSEELDKLLESANILEELDHLFAEAEDNCDNNNDSDDDDEDDDDDDYDDPEILLNKCMLYCREFIEPEAAFALNAEFYEGSEAPIVIGILNKKVSGNG